MTGTVLEGERYGATAESDMAFATLIMDELQRHYPGHFWDVAANSEAGHAAIVLMYPTKLDELGRPMIYSHMGFLLHLDSLKTNDGMRKVMAAGGELLERRKLPRRGYKDGDFLRAAENGIDTSGAIR